MAENKTEEELLETDTVNASGSGQTPDGRV